MIIIFFYGYIYDALHAIHLSGIVQQKLNEIQQGHQ